MEVHRNLFTIFEDQFCSGPSLYPSFGTSLIILDSLHPPFIKHLFRASLPFSVPTLIKRRGRKLRKVRTWRCKKETEGWKKIPPWSKQLTMRGMVASIAIGIMYSVIVMKLNLTIGLVPTLNVSTALLAIVFLRTWTKLARKVGFISMPFVESKSLV